MAKGAKTVWGIDVGNCTLKALKLGVGSEGAEVLDFSVIEYAKILTGPDVEPAERSELIQTALSKFLDEHDVKGSDVVVSVPGQSSFARFIKLPPVEPKRIPELVQYEAIQQIPFEISEVEWDWQTFQVEDSPEVEVGIFAIKNDLVRRALSPFVTAQCSVSMVQMAPMALFNFLQHDQKRLQESKGQEAVIALDIGAENTDLVISDGRRVWQRSIPIGGNQFTAAVQKAFKLGFAKAEAIKRSANTSKYARQIFQAMRPIFADLAGEVRRSLGFYSSSNRDVQFREVLALGNAMKLPGLVKFLQQSLSLPVKRLENFESLQLPSGFSMAQFSENLPSLGVVYGLAVQGLGLGTIDSNLLPKEIARESLWRKKRPWFVAASVLFLISGLLSLFHAYSEKADVEQALSQSQAIKSVSNNVKKQKSELDSLVGSIKSAQKKIKEYSGLYEKRHLLPMLLRRIREYTPNETNVTDERQKVLHEAFRRGDVETVLEVPRGEREQIFITKLECVYAKDLQMDFTTVLNTWSSRNKASRKVDSSAPAGPGGMMGPGMMGPGMMGPGMMGPGMMGPGMMGPGMMGGGGGGGSRRSGKRSRSSDELKKGEEKAGGFVVVIEGYTPNKDNLQFLRRPQVGLDRSQWGFFQKLQYMGWTDEKILAYRSKRREAQGKDKDESSSKSKSKSKERSSRRGGRSDGPGAMMGPGPVVEAASDESTTVDVNIPQTEYQSSLNKVAQSLPFETFIDPEGDLEYYFDDYEGDWISAGKYTSAEQPEHLGLLKPKDSSTSSGSRDGRQRPDAMAELLDPMTFEPISSTYVLDDEGFEKYGPDGKVLIEDHDYWFRVKFKVRFKDKAQAD